jgi:cytosine deaminase
VRLKATRLAVIKGGKVLSRTAPRIAQLSLEGRPDSVNPADYAPPQNT